MKLFKLQQDFLQLFQIIQSPNHSIKQQNSLLNQIIVQNNINKLNNKLVEKQIKQRHKLMPAGDLLSWEISNPSNLQDQLPQPYRLINQILQQTIIHNLQLSMHHIQQKKKNPNYQGNYCSVTLGKVQQYIPQSLIQIDHEISCLSSQSKYQNYLLAGDRKGITISNKLGNLLIIDVAKKSLYAKKQLSTNKRINYITQTTISDGQTFVTICAVISNNSGIIKILRSKHNQSKLFQTCDVIVSDNQNDISKLPYQCKLEDQARLLIVKTYQGTIIAYTLPQIRIDSDKIKNQQNINQTLSNASNTIKKSTIYPLQNSILDKFHEKITQKLFQIKFTGYQKPFKYKDLINKLKNKQKPVQTQAVQTNKKDSKKDTKKQQPQQVQQQPKQPQKQILLNPKQQKKQPNIWNNNDITDSYQLPKYQPFFYLLYEDVQCPRKKQFQKSKNIKMATKMIYGWTNTKQVYQVNLLNDKILKFQNTPYYQQFLLTQTLLTQDQINNLEQSYKKTFNSPFIQNKSAHLCNKTVYPITTSSISTPDLTHLALGLEDGTTSIYNTSSFTLQQNTQKHTSLVTQVRFFQNGWKLISGSQNGQIYITNLVQQKPQMKKTQLFESKQEKSIIDIKINQDIGVAFVIDILGNIRVYDLWRNQKISKFAACNSYAMNQGKGKKWMPISHFASASTIYTNRDYSCILSIDWPNIPTSKAVEVSKQLLNKVSQLKNNPLRSHQIHLHVIRNFQFLLDHFDGLQSVYKKGHQKSKIINLFTNLQFAQLYDRNFDIPDFGRTVNINGIGHHGSTVKSNLSSTSKFSNSKSGLHKKSPSKQKSLSGTSSAKQTSGQTRNVKLTTQILHPQKFLFERRKVSDPSKNLPTTNQKLIQQLREQHKKKQRRANILQDQLNRTSGGI